MPKVSVIIPTYNRAKFLLEAVNFVLQQTYVDFEIIIVDDGSKDDTKEVVGSFIRSSEKINYIYQANSGVANARNNGIVHSLGEYIAFLDDDDKWVNNKLEVQIRQMELDRNIGLCSSQALLEGAKRTSPKILPVNAGSTYIDLLRRNFICLSTTLIRKKCLNDIGLFREEFSPSEDYDLWLRVLRKYKFCFINEILAIYRKHNSNTTLDLERSYLAHIKVLKSIIRTRSDIQNIAVIKKSIANFYYRIARLCIENKKFMKTSKYFFMSVVYYPFIGLKMKRTDDKILKIFTRLFVPYIGIIYYLFLQLIIPSTKGELCQR